MENSSLTDLVNLTPSKSERVFRGLINVIKWSAPTVIAGTIGAIEPMYNEGCDTSPIYNAIGYGICCGLIPTAMLFVATLLDPGDINPDNW